MGRITLDETAGGASTVRLVDDTNSPQFTALALLSVIGEEGGEFSIENGAELRVNKDSGVIFNVTGRGVRLAGGTLSGFSPAFSGGFNNRGHMHWTSGVIGVPGLGEKSGELFNEGGRAVLLIDGAAGERVLAGTLFNNGRIEQSGDLVLSGGRIFYGGKFANSHWSLSADIVVDGLGGRIELINGALLEVAADKQVSIAADFSNRGEVHLQANSKLAVTGAVTQNALGVLTGGKWKLDSDSRLSLAGGPIEKIGAGASVTLAKRSVFEGLELVANDGTLELDSLAELETAADFTNAGELRVKEGSSLFVNGTFDNSGEVFSGNGAIVVKVLENRGTMTLSSGTLNATVLATNKGNMTLHRMVVNGGVIFANAPGATLILQNTRLNAETLSLQGTFRGTGVLNGEVHNFGTLAPGASPGTIEINGDFIAEAGSTLVVEFAGLGDGEFDLIEVHGDAALDGTLEIRFLDGFLPTRGDQLDFLAIDGSLTGAFAQFLFPELAPKFEFATQFADGRFGIVALTDAAAVPIPPAAGLLSAGLALLWARRHRAGGIGTKSASQAIKI